MFARALTAAAAGCWLLLSAAPAQAITPGPSCSERVVKGDDVAIRVFFARNGTVQRYDVVTSHGNPEAENQLRLALERVYGPAGVNAPPVQIVSFKHGKSGNLMVPDKAVDSCGRTSSFL